VELELTQQRIDTALLVIGQNLLGEPPATHSTEQIAVRTRRGQIAGQDGVYLVLQSGPLTHQMGPAVNQTAQHTYAVIGQPHRWQKVRSQQLREDRGCPASC
jgi:hypothetical protein